MYACGWDEARCLVHARNKITLAKLRYLWAKSRLTRGGAFPVACGSYRVEELNLG